MEGAGGPCVGRGARPKLARLPGGGSHSGAPFVLSPASFVLLSPSLVEISVSFVRLRSWSEKDWSGARALRGPCEENPRCVSSGNSTPATPSRAQPGAWRGAPNSSANEEEQSSVPEDSAAFIKLPQFFI